MSVHLINPLFNSNRGSLFGSLLSSLLVTGALVSGCADSQLETPMNNELFKSDSDSQATKNEYVDLEFGLMTELGAQILEESRIWEAEQLTEADEYAQPRMCAHNVSRVLEMSGLPAYSDYLVPHMINAVKARGGLVTQLDTRDKQGFISSLNQLFDGHIPVGALVNGCLYRDCSGEGGDGHIAIMGHTDSDGVVYLYHNNWYRPDNEGGERKPYMVSEAYYDEYNLRRQWMATPWIRVHRDTNTKKIVEVEGLLPAIDDLDPYTGFFLTVSVMPELLKELDALPTEELFCFEGMSADPLLGACVAGDDDHSEDAEVYGDFSDAMVAECVARGYGTACTTQHTLETDRYKVSVYRWSRRVYENLRGERACPRGLKIDHEIGYCVQPANEELDTPAEAFGPFSVELVNRCFSWGGGNACASGRWSLDFLKSML